MIEMLDDKDESFQPKSLIFHSPDICENIQRQLGVINFNESFGNHNAIFEGVMKLILDVENAIEQGIIDLTKKPELKLNESSVYRLKRLWNSTCHITIDPTKPETETFHYDDSNLDYSNQELEIIPIPSLDQMDLTRKKKEKTLLVEISELIPIKFAWEGLSWATLIEYGGFKIQTLEGSTPTITKDDMDSLTILTSDISRHVYNRIIKKEKTLFFKHWYVVKNNIHKIIHYLKIGVKEEEANPYSAKRMMSVE